MAALLDVLADYRNGRYDVEVPNERFFPTSHIFDENKSVVWNRGEVARRNAEIKTRRDEALEHSRQMERLMRDDAVNALIDEYDLKRAVAEAVWDFAYREKHAFLQDVFYFAGELAEFVKRVVNLSNPAE